jgi:hypothetical protein
LHKMVTHWQCRIGARPNGCAKLLKGQQTKADAGAMTRTELSGGGVMPVRHLGP